MVYLSIPQPTLIEYQMRAWYFPAAPYHLVTLHVVLRVGLEYIENREDWSGAPSTQIQRNFHPCCVKLFGCWRCSAHTPVSNRSHILKSNKFIGFQLNLGGIVPPFFVGTLGKGVDVVLCLLCKVILGTSSHPSSENDYYKKKGQDLPICSNMPERVSVN